MNVGGGEAADQMMRMMLSGGEVTLRLGASAMKNLIVISVALARNHKSLSGKIAMKQMLQQTRDLRVFPMTEPELAVFQAEAKHEKILYSVIRDKRTGQIDVVLPVTDLDRANHVFERMLYRGAGAKEQKKDAPEQERQPKKENRSEQDLSEQRDSYNSVSSPSDSRRRTTNEKRFSVSDQLRAYRNQINQRRASDPARTIEPQLPRPKER